MNCLTACPRLAAALFVSLLMPRAFLCADDPKPNIIIILADDLGYGDVGSFGAQLIRTPNLDRLAAEGVRCTSYYACGNVCTPSRAGLLTGRHPVRMGMGANDIFPGSTAGLPQSEVTIAEVLKTAGYATTLIGKWHLGELPEFWPTRHGFDSFYGLIHANGWNPVTLYDGEKKVEEPADQSTLTVRYAARAVEFIEANADSPFFLFFSSTMPHLPLAASERFKGGSPAGLYGDAVEELDWAAGQIMDAVARKGLDDRTLILFTSDNGPDTEGDTGPFRGGKAGIWEGGFRVPLIARWRGRIPPAGTSAAVLSGLDLFPTLVRLAGAQVSSARPPDGLDVWESLSNPQVPQPALNDRALVLFQGNLAAAVRQGVWKFISLPFPQLFYSYKPGLLFNLDADPAERYNQADRSRDVAEAMNKILLGARADIIAAESGPADKLANSAAGSLWSRARRSRHFIWVKLALACGAGLVVGWATGRRAWRRV